MKRLLTAMVGIVGLTLLASCRQEEKPTTGAVPATPKPTMAKPAAPAQPIKIGAIFAVTGPASFLGAPEAKTAEMIVEKINADGGLLGRPIELIIKDTSASSDKAVSFARQLIDEEKVVAIIGPSTSGETMSIKDLCQEAGTVLVSCAAADPIVDPVAPYVFKTPQKASQAVAWIYKTMKDMGITKVGVIAGNTGFGKDGRKQLANLTEKYGMEIVISEEYDKKATDLTAILTKVKAAGAEAVVNWSIVPAQALVAGNMKQIGFDVPLFQSHGFGNIKYVEQGGKATEGILFPGGRLLVVDVLADNHPQKEVLGSYKSDYEAKYGEDVSTFGGHAYDALMIVVKAVESAGSTESDKVRDAVENLKGFVGTAGTFNFSATDHTGLDLSAFEMLVVKDGKFEIHK